MILDFEEVCALLGEKSTMFANYTTPSPNCIVIRPRFVHQTPLFVQESYRNRTTYETTDLFTTYLLCAMANHHKGQNVFVKRQMTSMLIFNEQLGLRNLFVPMDIIAQLTPEEQAQLKNPNLQIYQYVKSKIQAISSRDKFASGRIMEDIGNGECGVCQ